MSGDINTCTHCISKSPIVNGSVRLQCRFACLLSFCQVWDIQTVKEQVYHPNEAVCSLCLHVSLGLKGIGQKCGRAEKSAGLRAFFPSVRFETFRQSKNKSIIRMKRCVLSVSMCPWAWRALAKNVVELRKVQVCVPSFLLSGLRHSDSQRTSLSSEWSGVFSLSPCVLGPEGHWPKMW